MCPSNSRQLRVDLDNGEIAAEEVAEATLRKFIGGAGLASKVLWDETDEEIDAFSPENRLMFMVGPLTDVVPLSSRYGVFALSPATDAWGEAYSGGRFPTVFRRTGFSSLVIRGRAPHPVYLYLTDEGAEIRDASHLWGEDAYRVSDLLLRETHPRASVAAIGRSGERLVRLAGIINDGPVGRAAARGGLGAVMGSKNLKAVVVRGNTRPAVADPTAIEGLNRQVYETLKAVRPGGHTWNNVVRGYGETGNLPIRNMSVAHFPEFVEMILKEFHHPKPYFCPRCPVSCINSHVLPEGNRAPTGEVLLPVGSNCMITDLDAMNQAYHLCNKYGLDGTSVGYAISFAMECFENGLITTRDTGGVELTWGNAAAMLETVRQIGEAEGFGRVLGQGVKRAAEQIGDKAKQFAIHCKGLEPGYHDPRVNSANFVGYSTSNRGCSHMESMTFALKQERPSNLPGAADLSEVGLPATGINRLGLDDKCGVVRKLQDISKLLDSLVVCNFGFHIYGFKVSTYLDWLNAANGWNMSLSDFVKTGERIFNLQRLINLRRGLTARDDTLPDRFLTMRPGLEGKEVVPSSLPALMQEYYQLRGWTTEGGPSPGKLQELELVGPIVGAAS